MKSKHAVSVLYSLLLSTLLFLAALPAHATFPGVNGRIAFGRYNLRSMVGNSTPRIQTALMFSR